MTSTAQRAFAVVRWADEHELETYEIAVRARLTKGEAIAATRDLHKSGIFTRRQIGRRILFGINHGR